MTITNSNRDMKNLPEYEVLGPVEDDVALPANLPEYEVIGPAPTAPQPGAGLPEYEVLGPVEGVASPEAPAPQQAQTPRPLPPSPFPAGVSVSPPSMGAPAPSAPPAPMLPGETERALIPEPLSQSEQARLRRAVHEKVDGPTIRFKQPKPPFQRSPYAPTFGGIPADIGVENIPAPPAKPVSSLPYIKTPQDEQPESLQDAASQYEAIRQAGYQLPDKEFNTAIAERGKRYYDLRLAGVDKPQAQIEANFAQPDDTTPEYAEYLIKTAMPEPLKAKVKPETLVELAKKNKVDAYRIVQGMNSEFNTAKHYVLTHMQLKALDYESKMPGITPERKAEIEQQRKALVDQAIRQKQVLAGSRSLGGTFEENALEDIRRHSWLWKAFQLTAGSAGNLSVRMYRKARQAVGASTDLQDEYLAYQRVMQSDTPYTAALGGFVGMFGDPVLFLVGGVTGKMFGPLLRYVGQFSGEAAGRATIRFMRKLPFDVQDKILAATGARTVENLAGRIAAATHFMAQSSLHGGATVGNLSALSTAIDNGSVNDILKAYEHGFKSGLLIGPAYSLIFSRMLGKLRRRFISGKMGLYYKARMSDYNARIALDLPTKGELTLEQIEEAYKAKVVELAKRARQTTPEGAYLRSGERRPVKPEETFKLIKVSKKGEPLRYEWRRVGVTFKRELEAKTSPPIAQELGRLTESAYRLNIKARENLWQAAKAARDAARAAEAAETTEAAKPESGLLLPEPARAAAEAAQTPPVEPPAGPARGPSETPIAAQPQPEAALATPAPTTPEQPAPTPPETVKPSPEELEQTKRDQIEIAKGRKIDKYLEGVYRLADARGVDMKAPEFQEIYKARIKRLADAIRENDPEKVKRYALKMRSAINTFASRHAPKERRVSHAVSKQKAKGVYAHPSPGDRGKVGQGVRGEDRAAQEEKQVPKEKPEARQKGRPKIKAKSAPPETVKPETEAGHVVREEKPKVVAHPPMAGGKAGEKPSPQAPEKPAARITEEKQVAAKPKSTSKGEAVAEGSVQPTKPVSPVSVEPTVKAEEKKPTEPSPKMEEAKHIVPISRDLKITNIEALPRGSGSRYLLVIRGEGDTWIAKQWKRRVPKQFKHGEILIDFLPEAKPTVKAEEKKPSSAKAKVLAAIGEPPPSVKYPTLDDLKRYGEWYEKARAYLKELFERIEELAKKDYMLSGSRRPNESVKQAQERGKQRTQIGKENADLKKQIEQLLKITRRVGLEHQTEDWDYSRYISQGKELPPERRALYERKPTSAAPEKPAVRITEEKQVAAKPKSTSKGEAVAEGSVQPTKPASPVLSQKAEPAKTSDAKAEWEKRPSVFKSIDSRGGKKRTQVAVNWRKIIPESQSGRLGKIYDAWMALKDDVTKFASWESVAKKAQMTVEDVASEIKAWQTKKSEAFGFSVNRVGHNTYFKFKLPIQEITRQPKPKPAPAKAEKPSTPVEPTPEQEKPHVERKSKPAKPAEKPKAESRPERPSHPSVYPEPVAHDAANPFVLGQKVKLADGRIGEVIEYRKSRDEYGIDVYDYKSTEISRKYIKGENVRGISDEMYNKTLIEETRKIEKARRDKMVPVESGQSDMKIWANDSESVGKIEKKIIPKLEKAGKPLRKKRPQYRAGKKAPKPKTLSKKQVKTTADTVKLLMKGAGKRPVKHYNYNGVYVDPEGYLVATDGWRQTAIKTDENIKPGFYSDYGNTIRKTGRLTEVDAEARFPKWRDVIPQYEASEGIIVDLEPTWKHLKLAKLMVSSEHPGVLIILNPDNTLGFASYDPSYGVAEINVQPGSKPYPHGVNPQFLIDAIELIRAHGETQATIFIGKDKDKPKPILVMEPSGRIQTVIMPVTLEVEKIPKFQTRKEVPYGKETRPYPSQTGIGTVAESIEGENAGGAGKTGRAAEKPVIGDQAARRAETITAQSLQARFPQAKVEETSRGWRLEMPNGKSITIIRTPDNLMAEHVRKNQDTRLAFADSIVNTYGGTEVRLVNGEMLEVPHNTRALLNHPLWENAINAFVPSAFYHNGIIRVNDQYLNMDAIEEEMHHAAYYLALNNAERRLLNNDPEAAYHDWYREQAHASGPITAEDSPVIRLQKAIRDGTVWRARQAGESPIQTTRFYTDSQTGITFMASYPKKGVGFEPPKDKSAYLKQSDWYKKFVRQYVTSSGEIIANSREVPSKVEIPPIGTWMIDDSFSGIYGRMIDQLRLVPVNQLIIPEGDYTDIRQNAEGRGWDAQHYSKWLREGKVKTTPPISVVETDTGNLKVSDGHRRVAAFKMAGIKEIPAWVSPRMDTGKVDADGEPIYTALTYEGAIYGAAEAERMVEEKRKALFQSLSEKSAKAGHFQVRLPERGDLVESVVKRAIIENIRGYKAIRKLVNQIASENKIKLETGELKQLAIDATQRVKKIMAGGRENALAKVTPKRATKKHQSPKEPSSTVTVEEALHAVFAKAEKASEYGFKAGHRAALAEITAAIKLKKISEERIRRQLIIYIKRYLPKDLRGKMLTDVKNADTYGKLAKAIRKIRLLRSQRQLETAILRGKRFDRKRLLVSVKSERRGRLEELLKKAESIREGIKARGTITSKDIAGAKRKGVGKISKAEMAMQENILANEAAVRELLAIARQINEIIAEDQKDRLENVSVPMRRTAKYLRENTINSIREKAKQKKPSEGDRIVIDMVKEAGVGKRAARSLLTPENRFRHFGELQHYLVRRAFEQMNLVFAGEHIDDRFIQNALKKVGLSARDARDLSHLLTDDYVAYAIPLDSGKTLRISGTQLMSLIATLHDKETAALAFPKGKYKGVPFSFATSKRGETYILAENDLKKLEKVDPRLTTLADMIAGYLRSFGPKVDEVLWALRGHGIILSDTYFTRHRNRDLNPKKGEPEGIEEAMPTNYKALIRYIENMMYGKERSQDTKQPFLIRDIYKEMRDYTRFAHILIHMGRLIRQLTMVVENPRVAHAIERYMGPSQLRYIKNYISELAGVARTGHQGFDRLVRSAVGNIASAWISANTRVWFINVFGGVSSLLHEFAPEDFLYGLSRMGDTRIVDSMVKTNGYWYRRWVSEITRVFAVLDPDAGGALVPVELDTMTHIRDLLQDTLKLRGKRTIGDIRALTNKIRGMVFADKMVGTVAYYASISKLKRLHPDWSKEQLHRVATEYAAWVFLRTQNGNLPMETAGWIDAFRKSGFGQMFAMFASDQNKQLNMLITGAHEGHLPRSATAVAMNQMWVKLIRLFYKYGVAAALAMFLADYHWNRKKTQEAWRYLIFTSTRDVLGFLPIADTIGDEVFDRTMGYGYGGLKSMPEDMAKDVIDGLIDLARAVLQESRGVYLSGPHAGEKKNMVLAKRALERTLVSGSTFLAIPGAPVYYNLKNTKKAFRKTEAVERLLDVLPNDEKIDKSAEAWAVRNAVTENDPAKFRAAIIAYIKKNPEARSSDIKNLVLNRFNSLHLNRFMDKHGNYDQGKVNKYNLDLIKYGKKPLTAKAQEGLFEAIEVRKRLQRSVDILLSMNRGMFLYDR